MQQKIRESVGPAVVDAQKIEPAPQARQHAESEHVDLQKPERFEIVLFPFDDGALIHRGIFDRHDLVDARARDQEAAGMLREMARRIDQFVGKLHDPIEPRIVRIETRLARLLLLHAALRPAPQHAGKRADRVVGQPEHLADFADRAAAAIADDGGGEVGVIAPVFFIDVLDHLFAAIVLEIDVDVGRLFAFL